MTLFVAFTNSVWAQPATADDKSRSDESQQASTAAAQLRARLSSLNRELERERSGEQSRRDRFSKEVQELRDQRAAVAGQLLTAQLERERNTAQLTAIREAQAQSTAAATALVEQAASVSITLNEAAEQLRLHLQEVPGTDAAVARLRPLATDLAALGESNRLAKGPKLLQSLFEAIETAHKQSANLAVESTEIFTAAGQRESVKLLRLGHVRCAYQTSKDGRFGLTLASPQGASGYRWTENLDTQTREMLRQAFAACDGQQAAYVSVPLEPTGRLPLDEIRPVQTIRQWFAAGGSVMYPIAAVAIASVVLIVERLVFFFGRNPNVNQTAVNVIQACAAQRFEDAEQTLRSGRGAVVRVLDACFKRRNTGQRAMEDGIQEQLLHELPRLRRFMGGLATLAGVAPLLGLLGTVTGIIQTFDVIRSFGNANPNLMAGGISEALITTEAGLMIAIPVVLVHSLLRGRSHRILADAEYYSATLLTTLVHGGSLSRQAERPPDARHRSTRNGKPRAASAPVSSVDAGERKGAPTHE